MWVSVSTGRSRATCRTASRLSRPRRMPSLRRRVAPCGRGRRCPFTAARVARRGFGASARPLPSAP
eukprot:10232535-Lingulodinium_polyedra.AAC.1